MDILIFTNFELKLNFKKLQKFPPSHLVLETSRMQAIQNKHFFKYGLSNEYKDFSYTITDSVIYTLIYQLTWLIQILQTWYGSIYHSWRSNPWFQNSSDYFPSVFKLYLGENFVIDITFFIFDRKREKEKEKDISNVIDLSSNVW